MGGKAWRSHAILRRVVAFVGILGLGLALPAEARITGITYTPTLPFGTHIFGSVGEYEELVGTATGELVPEEPLNRIITDIDLAPRVHGKVQYSFTFTIRRPVDLSKSNGTLLYDVANRGVKTVTALQCVIPNPPAFCDGSLENQGFIIVWSGWEGDLLTAPGRFQLYPPVAKEPRRRLDNRAHGHGIQSELACGIRAIEWELFRHRPRLRSGQPRQQ